MGEVIDSLTPWSQLVLPMRSCKGSTGISLRGPVTSQFNPSRIHLEVFL
jgi:hypothetical protein